MSKSKFRRRSPALVLAMIHLSFFASWAAGESFPGGFIEKSDSTATRAKLTQAQIQAFVPSRRGKFTFPPPYNTEGIRLTIPSDCGGRDCVMPVGYSYWRNINNHQGSDTMLMFVGTSKERGGAGAILISYNKVTGEVKNLGPLFEPSSSWANHSGEGWYFSAVQPTKLYLSGYSSQFHRFDVASKALTTVYDAGARFGPDKIIGQPHSSADDRIHSATLTCRNVGCGDGVHVARSADEMMGCLVYKESTKQFLYFPRKGKFDECQIDKSGRWLVILEEVDGRFTDDFVDNVIVDLETGKERILLANQQKILGTKFGALAHSDLGYGYVIGGDSSYSLPNAKLLYKFGREPLEGILQYYTSHWSAAAPVHLSHLNAKPDVPPEQQYACGSGASPATATRANEIVCFPLDGSMRVLVVAPVMTDMKVRGDCDDYCKLPKGNIDVTGDYFIWTSNMGGNRLDAFLVKIPAHLLFPKQAAQLKKPN